MTQAIQLTKQAIRRTIISRLRSQKEETRLEKSKAICKKLFQLDRIKNAKIIMFYISFDAEVDTSDMITKALTMGKEVTVPVCVTQSRKITPCKMGFNEVLMRGPYGVHEPATKNAVPLEKLDVVVIPAIAFDEQGNRLGRGKGYYDRFLEGLPKHAYRVGLAFDFQILPSIPLLRHDLGVDKVIFA